MIDRIDEVRYAVCDVCGMNLIEDEGNVNYALLEPCFGYGSPIDGLVSKNKKYDLCYKCYLNVVEHLDSITTLERRTDD